MSETNPLDSLTSEALDNISSRKAIKLLLRAQHAEEKARKKEAKRLRKQIRDAVNYELEEEPPRTIVHDYRIVACNVNGKPVDLDAFPAFRIDAEAAVLRELHSCLNRLLHTFASTIYQNEVVSDNSAFASMRTMASPQSIAHMLEAAAICHSDIEQWYARRLNETSTPQPEPEAD